jgi:hypothetical protein
VPTKGEVEAEDLVGGKFAEFLKLPDNGLRTRFGGFYYEDYAVLWTRTPSWGADTKKFTDNRAWSIRGKQFKYLYWNGNGMGVIKLPELYHCPLLCTSFLLTILSISKNSDEFFLHLHLAR